MKIMFFNTFCIIWSKINYSNKLQKNTIANYVLSNVEAHIDTSVNDNFANRIENNTRCNFIDHSFTDTQLSDAFSIVGNV